MSTPLYFDGLHVGDHWRSEQRTICQSDVSQFAELTGDFNPLHLDPNFARDTPFRRPIAHGLLGLSFVAGLSSQCPIVDTAAFLGVREWRFVKPVYFGDTVHVLTEILSLQPHGRRRGRVFWKQSLINQHDQVVQEGVFETLVMTSSAARLSTKPSAERSSQLQTASR